MAKAALGRKIAATVNGRKRQMTVAEIAYRRLGDKAMAGDQKALAFLLMLANNIEPSETTPTDSGSNTPEQDLAIIADYFSRKGRKSGSK
jgi:hypothetical protein